MSQSKEQKILVLLQKGMHDPKQIARRLGYKGNALAKGLKLIDEVIETHNKQGRML